MESFPEYKVFFVILEGNNNKPSRPFAVTVYKDYLYEDLYATIVDELSRQANGQILFDVLEEPSLILDGIPMRPEEFTYDLFEKNHVYKVVVDWQE